MPPSHLLNLKFAGYDWERLLEGLLVVDVGGGIDGHSLTLAKHHPQLGFFVQDRESVVGDAIDVRAMNLIGPKICRSLINTIHLPQYWKKNMPNTLESRRVEIQGSTL